jgi:AcrR family transcriptional regulator
MVTVLPILGGDVKARHTGRVSSSSGEPPPSRRSRGRPAIASERIVGAALELVDADGAEALSMRTLAQRLDSGTATLYRHFAGRAQLVAAVVDLVFGEVDLDATVLADHTWQRSCEMIASAMFDTLSQHPNVAQLLLEQTPFGPNAMMLREKSLAVLLANGFTAELAARSYATLSRFVLGFAIQLSGQPDAQIAQDAEAFQGVDPLDFPATLAAAGAMPVPLEEEFAFGLELIIRGLDGVRRHSVPPDVHTALRAVIRRGPRP